MQSPKIIKLKDGSYSDNFTVAIVMLRLKQLFEDDFATFKTLINYCHRSQESLSKNMASTLEHYCLCENGIIPEWVKKIIQSATENNSEFFFLSSPIAQNND